jgi:hypothetical protein
MAKPKATPAKTPKKRSTKYSKLAAVCSKELTAKKKALVLAEKRLAKATKTHQELLQEVARLDMLDRSLRAVNEGLEPPQNVKYVYSYPQWVWNPGWHTVYNTPYYQNGTITLGSFQGGQTLANINTVGQNSINLTTSAPVTTTYTSNSGSFCNSGSLIGSSSAIPSSGSVLSCSNSDGVAWTNATPTFDINPLATAEAKNFNLQSAYSLQTQADAPGTITVDLSTFATEFDEVNEPAAVGVGG